MVAVGSWWLVSTAAIWSIPNDAVSYVQRIADHRYQLRWYYSYVIRCAAVTRYVVDMFAQAARAVRSDGAALKPHSEAPRRGAGMTP